MIKHYKDIWFTVVAKPKEHYCEFKVYKIVALVEGEEPMYDNPETNWSPDPVDLEEAEPYLHGSVKWDGCSNWHFDKQDEVMLHFCGKEEATNIGKLFDKIYELSSEIIPKWTNFTKP